MKIHHRGLLPPKQVSEVYNLTQRGGEKADRQKIDPQKDRLELSPAAQELRELFREIRPPKVRAELVRELRSRIRNGTYQVSAGKIADRMLQEMETSKIKGEQDA